MADAFIQAGKYEKILLVGAELHSHSLDFSTRGRDVMVLFGDGAGAMIIGKQDTEDPKAGVLYTHSQANGAGAWNLYLKAFDIGKVPMVYYDGNDPEQNWDMYPHMKGKQVFMHAVRNMVAATKRALEKTSDAASEEADGVRGMGVRSAIYSASWRERERRPRWRRGSPLARTTGDFRG